MKVFIVLIVAVVLAGCQSSYEVKRCEGDVCSYAKIKSDRDFKNGLAIIYNGEARTFEFRTNSVTSGATTLEVAQLLAAYGAIATRGIVPPPAPTPDP